ncbi:MAG TPA: hypothetical protein VE685_19900 [Thermoanaerobaculia bacterium]|nr:hypothetical protein [Thermoanaerobaculia bacterium]
MASKSNPEAVGDWQNLLASIEANSADLAHLEFSRLKLSGTLDRVVDITKQQSALTASKQEMTRQLREALAEGNRLATVLRLAIKEHFGIRSEKLAEFGMQPFRGRPRKAKPPAPEPAPDVKL